MVNGRSGRHMVPVLSLVGLGMRKGLGLVPTLLPQVGELPAQEIHLRHKPALKLPVHLDQVLTVNNILVVP